MNLLLTRDFYTRRSTSGELFVNGEFLCYTLEDRVRPKGIKVYGKTAIPAGTYKVTKEISVRYQRPMPFLNNVPMFTGILIHIGNSPADTSGCILVGQSRSVDELQKSTRAFVELWALLEQAWNSGEEVQIEITNTETDPLYRELTHT
jgi:hypothetical protein